MAIRGQFLKGQLRAARRKAERTYMLRSGASGCESITLNGRPRIDVFPASDVRIGARVTRTSNPTANRLDAPWPCRLRTLTGAALLEIGDDTGATSVVISCAIRVSIGERVLIGSGVIITDTNHHPIAHSPDTPRRFAPMPTPKVRDAVEIGDDVFIGARAIILPATRIGPGSVVVAGSTVSGAFGADVVAPGNTARVVRSTASLS